MTRLPYILTLLLFAACSDDTAAPAANSDLASSPGTAITNVTVIDAVNGLRENQTVIFDGDEIIAVQDSSIAHNVAETIDGTNQYLIPGLWDFHVHLTYDDRLIAAMPELFLSWGITSVRDTGGLMDEILPVVESMRADDAIAPRVFFAGPLLDGEFVVYNGVGRPEIGVQVGTPEAARRQVREMHEQGVNFIKVYEMVSPEVFTALTEIAAQLDLPIDSHVPLSLRARDAGARVSSIEHLRNIEMDCAANAEQLHSERLVLLENAGGIAGAELRSAMHTQQRLPAIANYDEAECDAVIAALSETVMVPTLRLNSFMLVPPWQRDDWEEALSRLPPDVEQDWLRQTELRSAIPAGDPTFADWSLFLTNRMHEAGVPVGAGTDVPINLSVPGYSLHSELDMLVRAGLTPMEAIEAATLEPAKFFGLENEMGTIATGQVADLVLLEENPLDNINNTKRIARVISKGQLIEQ
ncbi:MAG: amidohydrolase [Pseudohongiella sp.]|nr:MAG: amidohydrolase [Pseudohongiella sp.]